MSKHTNNKNHTQETAKTEQARKAAQELATAENAALAKYNQELAKEETKEEPQTPDPKEETPSGFSVLLGIANSAKEAKEAKVTNSAKIAKSAIKLYQDGVKPTACTLVCSKETAEKYGLDKAIDHISGAEFGTLRWVYSVCVQELCQAGKGVALACAAAAAINAILQAGNIAGYTASAGSVCSHLRHWQTHRNPTAQKCGLDIGSGQLAKIAWHAPDMPETPKA